MLNTALNAALTYTDPTTVTSAPTPRPQPSPQATTPAGVTDTVKVSTSAQVLSMKQNGATVNQIAANLGLTATEVELDLGTTSSSSSSEASILAALSSKR